MITKGKKAGSKPALKFLEELTGGPLTFPELLLTLRENEDLSQNDFAKRLGITKQKLCDIEKGRREVSPAKAASFALKLGFPPEFFVDLALQDDLKKAGLKIKLRVYAA